MANPKRVCITSSLLNPKRFWKTSVLLLVCITSHSVDSNQAPASKVTGALDDGYRCNDVILEPCIMKGKTVIDDYIRALNKEEDYDICSSYSEFRSCFRSHLQYCSHAIQPSHSDWMALVDQLDLVCINRSTGHVVAHECFEDEMRGTLSLRCNEYYKFNLRQKTHHKCHFIREKIRCKESLVSSACGPLAADFVFHILKLSTEKQTDKVSCTPTKNDNTLSTFAYDNGCRHGFLEEVETCTTDQLKAEVIAQFHEHNDLIALGTEQQLKSACRAYEKFLKCLKPVNDSCSEGVALFLDYESNLRQYMLKMDYICKRSSINLYSSSLKCFQNVVDMKYLDRCDVHWDNLKPVLANITATQFFCSPHHMNTLNLISQTKKSHECHETIFQEKCGSNSSSLIARLMAKALRDPVYLRFGYKPDCMLHAHSSKSPHSPQPHPSLLHAFSSRSPSSPQPNPPTSLEPRTARMHRTRSTITATREGKAIPKHTGTSTTAGKIVHDSADSVMSPSVDAALDYKGYSSSHRRAVNGCEHLYSQTTVKISLFVLFLDAHFLVFGLRT